MKMLYLCNGEKTNCTKSNCYKNTDIEPCRYTSDIDYALNFKKEGYGEQACYIEVRRL